MNLSIIIPTSTNIVNNKKRYEYYSYDIYDIDDCPEWSLVMYELMDNNDIKNILEENIEKGKQLLIDMKLVIEGRLFSSNFENHFKKIKNSIIDGLKLFSSRRHKDTYSYEETLLLRKHTFMFLRLKQLCEQYSESKKIWWN